MLGIFTRSFEWYSQSNDILLINWRRVEFSFRDTKNLNMEKDYYNDLPGKLPPELLQNSDMSRKTTSHLMIQKPRERLSSNLIDLSSPPPNPDYVNDKSFDENSNTTPPAITRDVFDMRKCARMRNFEQH